ncbi:MAG: phosphate/phosphite/phosphonate ABC transporter substrate-binding protein [Calditerrivibrio sp.]|nr:phosphate/phosphite/phosphonate ABC transporter substrate-binding protein [Calditerrivibrio sp.]
MKIIAAFILFFSCINVYASQHIIKIGVSSIVSAETNIKMYDGLAEYVAKRLNVPTEIVYRKSYKEMNDLISNGDVDLSFICTGAYINLNNIEVLAVPQVEGKIYYKSLLIVNKKANINSLSDLKNKVFAFTDTLSNTGYLYPVYYFITNNILNRDYFKKVYYTNSHDKSIYLVNKGVVDAAAVDNMIYDYIKKNNPANVENINILHVSKEFPNPPVVVTNTIYRNKLEEILLNMHNDPEGRKILSNLHIDKFVKINKEEYNTVKNIKVLVDKHLKDAPNKIF